MPTSFDPLHSKLLKEIMDVIYHHLLSIINSSLSSGCVPDLFNMACVQLLLKGPTLDQADTQNFKPISKLSCLSKNMKESSFDTAPRVTKEQKQKQLWKISGFFWKLQSNETAFHCVSNDLLLLHPSAAGSKSSLRHNRAKHSYFETEEMGKTHWSCTGEVLLLPRKQIILFPFGISFNSWLHLWRTPRFYTENTFILTYTDDTQLYLPFKLHELNNLILLYS